MPLCLHLMMIRRLCVFPKFSYSFPIDISFFLPGRAVVAIKIRCPFYVLEDLVELSQIIPGTKKMRQERLTVYSDLAKVTHVT